MLRLLLRMAAEASPRPTMHYLVSPLRTSQETKAVFVCCAAAQRKYPFEILALCSADL